MNIIKKFLSHNWFAIIYFNFKMLPFKQAIKLPFDFYYKIRFESLTGKVIINCDNIYRGMIKFGGRGSDMFPHVQTVISLKGIFESGKQVEFGIGSITIIESDATLRLADRVRIGAMSKLYCEEMIQIAEEVDISWESQIFDTNFHYIENTYNKSINVKTAPIIIGSYNWIGNRVTVMKGTVIGNNMIIASNSLCNKDYSTIAPYSILGGSPAKLLKENRRRLFEKDEKQFILKNKKTRKTQ